MLLSATTIIFFLCLNNTQMKMSENFLNLVELNLKFQTYIKHTVYRHTRKKRLAKHNDFIYKIKS